MERGHQLLLNVAALQNYLDLLQRYVTSLHVLLELLEQIRVHDMAVSSARQVVASARATLGASTTKSATAHLALVAGARIEPLPLFVETAARNAVLNPRLPLLRIFEQASEIRALGHGTQSTSSLALHPRVVLKVRAEHLTQ